MANNDGVPETFHEVPASKYYYLGDAIGAVPKWLFKFWTPFIFCVGGAMTAIALETNWYQIFLTRAWQYFVVQNWVITVPAFFVFSGIGLIYVRYRGKQKAKAKKEADHQRAYQDALIRQGGGENKK